MGEFITVGYGKSINTDPQLAVNEAVTEALSQLGNAAPQYAYFFTTIDYDPHQVITALNERFNSQVKLHGLTSCRAVMSKAGFHQGTGGALALLLIASADLSFGTACSECATPEAAVAAGQTAVKQAIRAAGKTEDVIPQFVILNASPGIEEKIIAGIQTVVGTAVPIIGGSCADNTIEGQWQLFCQDRYFANGAVVTVGYGNLRVGYNFQGGYRPTEQTGRISKAAGRRVYEIDQRPAGLVYNEWTNGVIHDQLATGGNILGASTFYPLARSYGQPDVYLLSHPAFVTPDGAALDLFTEVSVGETLRLMAGSQQDLIQRTGSIMKHTFGNHPRIAGAIIIYCGGCMLGVADQMPEVVEAINQQIGTGVYIGGFTFGEQGYLGASANKHGNLMIATLTFYDERI